MYLSHTLATRGGQNQTPQFFAQKNFFFENRSAPAQFWGDLKNFFIFGLLIPNFIYDDLPGLIQRKTLFEKSL